ncbi:hypothetical protein PFISCL1PPCAC_19257, partial [Pristionchus fissidentatus]
VNSIVEWRARGSGRVVAMSDHRLAAMDSLKNDDHFYASTYEADIEVIDKRLKQLYPNVDFETTQVPTQWNREDKCSFMRVSHLNLRFTYPERAGPPSSDRKGKMEPGAVRANHPCPLFAGVYYFEVHILESDGLMGIGLCQKGVKMNRLPGWDALSYGYHGDDGNFFSASGTGTQYGPTFCTGDVVGCGLNLVRRSVFFTKNGENIGTAMNILDSIDELYPTVGLQNHNSIVDVNFGQKPFCYDIHKDLHKMRDEVKRQIEEMRLPVAKKKEWLNGYIASWLATEGHAGALKAFCEETKTEYDEIEIENVLERKELSKMVYAGRVGELCEDLESRFKKFDETRPLSLDLRAQRYAENILSSVKQPTAATNGVAKTDNGCAAPAACSKSTAAGAAASSASSSSISSSANGSAARPASVVASTAAAAANSSAAAAASAAIPISTGLGTSSMNLHQGPSSSSSSASLRGGTMAELLGKLSPSRPHKRRSSGAKVIDGVRRDSSASRPPSDMGPPPRRRSAKGERRREERQEEEDMDVDIPTELLERVAMSQRGTFELVDQATLNGRDPLSRKMQVTPEELHLLMTSTTRSSRGRSFGSGDGRDKNGSRRRRKKKGWEGTEIVDEGKSVVSSMKDHEEDQKLRCGYTKAEEEEADAKYAKLLEEGSVIWKELRVLRKKYPREAQYAEMALDTISCKTEEELKAHSIFGEMRARFLVHGMNRGLIKLEYGSGLSESRLARLEEGVRMQKVKLMREGCAAAPFIDIEGLLGRDEEEMQRRNKKVTVMFHDPEHVRMLARRKKQAELDEKRRKMREAQELAAKLHRQKLRKLKKKREERERMKMEGEGENMEGVEKETDKAKKKRRRKKRKEGGDERPPVLTAEDTPMEIEDGPSSSRGVRRSEAHTSSNRGSSSRGRRRRGEGSRSRVRMDRERGGEERRGGEEGGEPVGDANPVRGVPGADF